MFSGDCGYEKLCCIDRFILDSYSMVNRKIIGHTAVGREIISYTVGDFHGVLMCGAFHGMEHITAKMLLKFLVQVCERCAGDNDFYKTLSHTGLTVVPMVNPDGVEISINGADSAVYYKHSVQRIMHSKGISHTVWQANANGVDINHNFNAGFKVLRDKEIQGGYILPSHTRYGGAYPESESETRAIADLCRKNNYKVAVALHSQGREIYYDYGDNTPDAGIVMAEEMAKLSGYDVAQPEGIAVGGGFKDWFIERFSRPAFTIEVGKGQNPLPDSVFDTEYQSVEKMLWYIVDVVTKTK